MCNHYGAILSRAVQIPINRSDTGKFPVPVSVAVFSRVWQSVVFPTWICFFGVFFTLASDDEDKNKEEDEDQAHQSNHDQEPPLLIEWRNFLGWRQNKWQKLLPK